MIFQLVNTPGRVLAVNQDERYLLQQNLVLALVRMNKSWLKLPQVVHSDPSDLPPYPDGVQLVRDVASQYHLATTEYLDALVR